MMGLTCPVIGFRAEVVGAHPAVEAGAPRIFTASARAELVFENHGASLVIGKCRHVIPRRSCDIGDFVRPYSVASSVCA